MKPSTFIEVAGFGCLTYAAWLLTPTTWTVFAGVFLLFIGWAFDDATALVSIRRVTDPLLLAHRVRRTTRRTMRAQRREARPVSKRRALRIAAEELTRKAS